MFYLSYYDTSSIINENKPLRTTGVNGSKILCKFEVQNLYLKLEKGFGVLIIVDLTKSVNLNPKCLRGQFRFIPLSHNLMLACSDMTSKINR